MQDASFKIQDKNTVTSFKFQVASLNLNLISCIMQLPFAACILLLATVFSGCAAQQKIYAPLSPPDKSQLISHLKERSSIKTLKAIGSVEISRDDYQYSSKVIIAAKSPDLFRIEFLNILNQPTAILANNGIENLLYYSGNFYREDAFPKSFPLNNLQYLPFYIINWSYINVENIGNVSIDYDKGLYVISINSSDGSCHKIWLTIIDYKIIKREIYDRDDNKITAMVFGDYMEVEENKFPSSIKITADTLNINIRYERIELNKEVDEGLFFLYLHEE